MTDPREDTAGTFTVLVNDEGQHSLWPAVHAAPAGWAVVHGPDTRERCLAYVDDHWTDMRPKSLIEHADEYAKVRSA
ncbi:MbtH family protein [Yinghuangia sp. ASG 101]|uniref:MbtH family protein n=1 Tax=Yinghuangia sp. ASG 101 TaxID=2896848 RepID=UPI001E48C7B8|nr:MbtH family protein [Yinghuangia sp. ASG 101]UGQ12341.1 MbtH family protein [Yinghuangia sp. ASG 101]